MPANNLYEAFSATESQFGSKQAIRFIEEMDQVEPGLLWTYTDLFRQIRGAANLFHRCGINELASVALMVPNIPYGQVALFGAELAGRALPVNPLLHDDHIVSLLEAANAKVLVFSGDLKRAVAIQSKVPSLQHIFSLDGGEQCFAAAIARHDKDKLTFHRRTDPDTVVATFHTGGTTGTPKLVKHQQSNQLAVAYSLGDHAGIAANDVIVNGLPLFHVAGSLCFALTAIASGACQVLCTGLGARHPEFISKHWIMIENQKVTVMGGVPTTIGALVPTIPPTPPATLKKIITGGAALPISVEAALNKKLSIDLFVIYGMTECAGLLAIKRQGCKVPPGWIGPAAQDMEIRIVSNPEALEKSILPPMVSGHVIAKGAPVSPGYTNAALNTETFTNDGWFITGDLGMLDASGNLELTGRAKDLIIRSGHNIDPALIEEAAMKHPSVQAAAAVGAPDAYAGELPVLYVVADPHLTKIDYDTVLELIRQHVERPAVPKWIEELDALPLTAVGKIYKPALIARAIERALNGLLPAQKREAISVSAKEQDGIPLVEFVAKENERQYIDDLMAPFTVTYRVSNAD